VSYKASLNLVSATQHDFLPKIQKKKKKKKEKKKKRKEKKERKRKKEKVKQNIYLDDQ
jgi:hypothetical protein